MKRGDTSRTPISYVDNGNDAASFFITISHDNRDDNWMSMCAPGGLFRLEGEEEE